jgi:hypothetical protein
VLAFKRVGVINIGQNSKLSVSVCVCLFHYAYVVCHVDCTFDILSALICK